MDLVSWVAEPVGSSAPPRWGHSSAPGQGSFRRQQNSAVSGDNGDVMVIEPCQTPPAGGNDPCEVLSFLFFLSLPVPFMNTMDHSARESWCGDISIVVTSSIVRAQLHCGCSPSSMGPFVGRTYRTFSLPFAGPNCWAVMGAVFWKSRALSQLLPSSVQIVGEAGVLGWHVSLALPRPSSWDRRSL